MNRKQAQERADRIEAFREEVKSLADAGILRLGEEDRAAVHRHHEELLAGLEEDFDIDRSGEEKRLSWGMRIATLFAALALAAGIFFLFYQFWGYLNTTVQVSLVVAAPLAALGGAHWVSRREQGVFFTTISGLLAFACFVLNLQVLGTIYNVTPTQNAFLAWGGMALILAYAWRAKLLLVTGILCVLGWLSATIGTWSGCYWLSFGERPENFMAAGAALFCVPLLLPHPRHEEFPTHYRVWGGLAVLISILILSNYGSISYLHLDPDAIEILYQCLGFLVSAGLAWIGARMGWRATANLGVTFFVLQLYTKFFDWWWDWMPKYLFFLLLGLISVGVLVALGWMRRRRKERDA